MSYVAKDGRRFGHPVQGRKYDESLERDKSETERGKQDVESAPGGEMWEADLNAHGMVTKITIENEGPGRWRHTALHADGIESTSVHPEAYRAHQVAGHYMALEPPPAIATHSRARSFPVGPKEKERLDREDNREVEDEER